MLLDTFFSNRQHFLLNDFINESADVVSENLIVNARCGHVVNAQSVVEVLKDSFQLVF